MSAGLEGVERLVSPSILGIAYAFTAILLLVTALTVLVLPRKVSTGRSPSEAATHTG